MQNPRRKIDNRLITKDQLAKIITQELEAINSGGRGRTESRRTSRFRVALVGVDQ
jgi:hypothetical protein